MTTAVQHRRGTTAEHSTFTGLEGELTIDTTKDTAVIHDGSLAGGYPLAKETLANVNPSTLSAITGAATASDDLFLMYDTSALAMKKISRAELNNAITVEALDTVDINGGTIDGTAIGGTTPAAGAFTTLSASSSVTLSGGTANGVAYLNGSKVLTSESALTFDGTTLSNTTGAGGVGFATYSSGETAERTTYAAAAALQFASYQGVSGSPYTKVSDLVANADGTAPSLMRFWVKTSGSSSPSEQMRLTSTGLGIGTSSSAYKLHVYTNSTTASQITAESASAGVNAEFIAKSTAATWRMGTNIGLTGGQWEVYGGSSPSSKIVLDSSGNLGLGVTPSAWSGSYRAHDIGGALGLTSSTTATVWYNSYDNGTNSIYKNSGYAASAFVQDNGSFKFLTAPSGTAGNAITFTQAMTLDASGNLLVGTTNSNPIANSTAGTLLASGIINAARASHSLELSRLDTTGAIAYWYYNNATIVGNISITASSTSYNTSSDYRLKNTIAPMTGALAKVALLKPVTYKWNADGSDGEGFLAHELAEVCPQAVTGEKDAVDADGNPQYQGIDTSFLVATLTAAIQEQQAIIESLKARLDAANI